MNKQFVTELLNCNSKVPLLFSCLFDKQDIIKIGFTIHWEYDIILEALSVKDKGQFIK